MMMMVIKVQVLLVMCVMCAQWCVGVTYDDNER
jgi:hypothetical protein